MSGILICRYISAPRCTDLEACAGQHQSYKRAANLVEAVHQLMEHFQRYDNVPKASKLAKCMLHIFVYVCD